MLKALEEKRVLDETDIFISIFEVEPPRQMDERVMSEAMTTGETPPIKPVEQVLEAKRFLGFRVWSQ